MRVKRVREEGSEGSGGRKRPTEKSKCFEKNNGECETRGWVERERERENIK